jgi:hypothetical protein
MRGIDPCQRNIRDIGGSAAYRRHYFDRWYRPSLDWLIRHLEVVLAEHRAGSNAKSRACRRPTDLTGCRSLSRRRGHRQTTPQLSFRQVASGGRRGTVRLF